MIQNISSHLSSSASYARNTVSHVTHPRKADSSESSNDHDIPLLAYTGGIPTDVNNRTPPGISFDRFVRCCVSVKALTDSFMAVDEDRDGWAHISYDQFLLMALSAP